MKGTAKINKTAAKQTNNFLLLKRKITKNTAKAVRKTINATSFEICEIKTYVANTLATMMDNAKTTNILKFIKLFFCILFVKMFFVN